MSTKKLMYKLVEVLGGKGFIIQYYKAYTTDSCYLKLDYGLSNSIRVADHIGKEKYNYRFNLMLNLKESYEEGNRKYYCLGDFDTLIRDIIKFREDQLDKYGFYYYEYMLNNKKDLLKGNSSWKHAKSNDN